MVTIYSQPNCPKCTATKKSLNRANIDYTDIDITSNEEGMKRVKELGYQRVPVIEANGEHWSGYDPEKLAALK